MIKTLGGFSIFDGGLKKINEQTKETETYLLLFTASW